MKKIIIPERKNWNSSFIKPDGAKGRPRRFELLDELESIPDPRQDLDPPEVFENKWRKDRLAAIKRLIDSGEIKKVLPPRQSEIMNMRMGGMTSKDIGKLLGLSTRTVEAHIFAAKKNLKLAVEDEI